MQADDVRLVYREMTKVLIRRLAEQTGESEIDIASGLVEADLPMEEVWASEVEVLEKLGLS